MVLHLILTFELLVALSGLTNSLPYTLLQPVVHKSAVIHVSDTRDYPILNAGSEPRDRAQLLDHQESNPIYPIITVPQAMRPIHIFQTAKSPEDREDFKTTRSYQTPNIRKIIDIPFMNDPKYREHDNNTVIEMKHMLSKVVNSSMHEMVHKLTDSLGDLLIKGGAGEINNTPPGKENPSHQESSNLKEDGVSRREPVRKQNLLGNVDTLRTDPYNNQLPNDEETKDSGNRNRKDFWGFLVNSLLDPSYVKPADIPTITKSPADSYGRSPDIYLPHLPDVMTTTARHPRETTTLPTPKPIMTTASLIRSRLIHTQKPADIQTHPGIQTQSMPTQSYFTPMRSAHLYKATVDPFRYMPDHHLRVKVPNLDLEDKRDQLTKKSKVKVEGSKSKSDQRTSVSEQKEVDQVKVEPVINTATIAPQQTITSTTESPLSTLANLTLGESQLLARVLNASDYFQPETSSSSTTTTPMTSSTSTTSDAITTTTTTLPMTTGRPPLPLDKPMNPLDHYLTREGVVGNGFVEERGPPTPAHNYIYKTTTPNRYLVTGSPLDMNDSLSPQYPSTTIQLDSMQKKSRATGPPRLLLQTLLVSASSAFAILVFGALGLLIACYRKPRSYFGKSDKILKRAQRRAQKGRKNSNLLVSPPHVHAVQQQPRQIHFHPRSTPSLSGNLVPPGLDQAQTVVNRSPQPVITPYYYQSDRSELSLISGSNPVQHIHNDRHIETHLRNANSVVNLRAAQAIPGGNFSVRHQQHHHGNSPASSSSAGSSGTFRNAAKSQSSILY